MAQPIKTTHETDFSFSLNNGFDILCQGICPRYNLLADSRAGNFLVAKGGYYFNAGLGDV